jgi:hypothetical protein
MEVEKWVVGEAQGLETAQPSKLGRQLVQLVIAQIEKDQVQHAGEYLNEEKRSVIICVWWT